MVNSFQNNESVVKIPDEENMIKEESKNEVDSYREDYTNQGFYSSRQNLYDGGPGEDTSVRDQTQSCLGVAIEENIEAVQLDRNHDFEELIASTRLDKWGKMRKANQIDPIAIGGGTPLSIVTPTSINKDLGKQKLKHHKSSLLIQNSRTPVSM